MNLEHIISDRLSISDIRNICQACSGKAGDPLKTRLYTFISHPDDRIAYNALWVFSHLSHDDLAWLADKTSALMTLALSTPHTGRQRLLLTLIERLKPDKFTTEFLNFCLKNINSSNPYGIRALCLRLSFIFCIRYPELISELTAEIEMMQYGPLSPGLLSARKSIIHKIAALGAAPVL